MQHEKIIKRDDGSRVKIRVELICELYCKPRWAFQCYKCQRRKRTWTTPINHDDYAWRRLDHEQRQAEDRRLSLTLATEDEVADAMRELLTKIKPVV